MSLSLVMSIVTVGWGYTFQLRESSLLTVSLEARDVVPLVGSWCPTCKQTNKQKTLAWWEIPVIQEAGTGASRL